MSTSKLNKIHREALARLENLIDPEHVAQCERVQHAAWSGEELPYLPTIVGTSLSDWPAYSFTECWDDVEKNFMTGLAGIYAGAVLRDDRLFSLRPEYGVVNIPELFGIPSVVSDEGRSMTEGLHDTALVRELVRNVRPDFRCSHARKVLDFYQYAEEALRPYEKLSSSVHFVLPDTQGPFDLACLIWGTDIFVAMHDEPELVSSLIRLMTDTYIEYNKTVKTVIGEAPNSAYHIAGLKLVQGGVRICDDSATLVSADFYRDLIMRENERAFAPFGGGWLHYCGNGNHLQSIMQQMRGVHAMHLGNPDMHDLLEIGKGLIKNKVTLFWSGSLDKIDAWRETFGLRHLIFLAENRYAGRNLNDSRDKLQRLRACEKIERAEY